MKNNIEHLYIHIPFCVKKCPYCDFYSVENKKNDFEIQEKYTLALVNEINFYSSKVSNLKTLYFGGGTPSLLRFDLFENIFNKIKGGVNFDEDIEITIELNPETVNFELLKKYKKLGINRISMGVQSLDNNELKILNRIHTKEKAIEIFYLLRKIGFDNINIDIMSGIPNQSKNILANTIKEIIKLNPEHISAYILTYYEDTKFYNDLKSKKIEKLTDDKEISLYNFLIVELDKNGYTRYEISNFSKGINYKSKHNLNTWNHGDYLGLGVSASSKEINKRRTNLADINKYIQFYSGDNFISSSIYYENIIISDTEKYNEYIMLQFRKTEGLNFADFKKEFSYNFYDKNIILIEKYLESSHLKLSSNKETLYLTNKGFDVYNYIVSDFFIE